VRAFRRSPGSYDSYEMNVADYRFHTTLWAAAGKPYLYQQLSLVFDHTESPRVLARLLHDPEASSNEHQEILDALRRHDVGGRASGAAGGHRSHGIRRAIEALRQKRNPSRARPQHSTLGE
jgi:DNA-binding GntR family transcriptional regulator